MRATHGLQRPDLVGESPCRCLFAVGAPVLAPLEKQRSEHRRTHDGGDQQRAAGIPGDAVFEDAKCHGGGRNGGQMTQPSDDERREREHQVGQAECGTEGHAEDAGTKKERQERQSGGDCPHERREPCNRDPEHQGSLAALG